MGDVTYEKMGLGCEISQRDNWMILYMVLRNKKTPKWIIIVYKKAEESPIGLQWRAKAEGGVRETWIIEKTQSTDADWICKKEDTVQGLQLSKV